ncbi:hypothetical protein PTTG_25338 [Puccinia triticina 1-1 BBBD Race 1]|uniref:Uncharacterized protein n=1 Tax=Puccinia triticina (isolate 1-1 / race 1 (BBBD)) TaxID=630390 RepID=A0A180H3S1_PUCT1|nr:hypothetical protein PTTG_25338 [Puccinia triticina 1-1 BBBD Race 1]
MFMTNNIPDYDIEKLMNLWTTTGLAGKSGLTCKCPILGPNSTKTQPKPKKLRKNKKSKKRIANESDEDEPLIARVYESNELHHIMDETSRLVFKNGEAPLHLYFFVDVTTLPDGREKQEFLALTNWPFKLNLHGASYTLFSRGFYGRKHYWCKVLRTGRAGTTGIWLHNDMQNNGIARLVNPDAASISGKAPMTSWLMYSRTWTPIEEEFVTKSISNITRDHPNARGRLPFLGYQKLFNVGTGTDGTTKSGGIQLGTLPEMNE